MFTVPLPPTGTSSTQGQLLVYFAEKGSLENCNFYTIYATERESIFSKPETQCWRSYRAHGELKVIQHMLWCVPKAQHGVCWWCSQCFCFFFFNSHSHSLFHAQTRGGWASSDSSIYKSVNGIDNEGISSVTEIHIIGNRALDFVGFFVAKNALVGQANV